MAHPYFQRSGPRGRVGSTRRIEAVLHHANGIVAHGREAGDSIDFHARHGRVLHARAARESLEMLRALFRSPRRRRASRRPPWETVWPAAEPSHYGRP
jgi:hypothetical protein